MSENGQNLADFVKGMLIKSKKNWGNETPKLTFCTLYTNDFGEYFREWKTASAAPCWMMAATAERLWG